MMMYKLFAFCLLSFLLVSLSAVPALATGDPSFDLGDFNMDYGIDDADIDLLLAEVNAGTNNSEFDLTGDAIVDQADADELIREILGTEYGDATLDFAVNAADLSILAQYWMATSGRGWATGDFTGDGAVNAADLSLLAQNWLWKAQSVPGPAGHAPEPLTMATVGLSVLVVGGLARRRGKSAAKKF